MLSSEVKSFRIEQSTAVVVAQNTELKLADLVQTLAGGWAVTDDVAQANNAIDVLAVDILQHGLQCRVVAMDIAYDGGSSQFGRSEIGAVRLSTVLQSIAEPIGKVRNVVNLVCRFVDLVLDSAEV